MFEQNAGSNLIFTGKARVSIHENTSSLKENINDENRGSPTAIRLNNNLLVSSVSILTVKTEI